jgi:ribosomal protein S18 acetylase RimI-like enzyme
MQTLTIHKATPQEAPLIAALAQELAQYEGEPSAANASGIAKAMQAEPACHAMLARAGEEAIGFVLYYAGYDLSSDAIGFHLADMYVAQAYRQKGVGEQLMKAVAQHARKEGREWLSLTALRENETAQAFYHALGFVPVNVDFYAIGATGLHKIIQKTSKLPLESHH